MQGNMPVLILAIVVRLCYANKHGLPSWKANVDFLKAIVQRYMCGGFDRAFRGTSIILVILRYFGVQQMYTLQP